MKEKTQAINNVFGILTGIILILSLFSPKTFDNSNIEFFFLIINTIRLELILILLYYVLSTTKLIEVINLKLKNIDTGLYDNIPRGKFYYLTKNLIASLFLILGLLIVINIFFIGEYRITYYTHIPKTIENNILKKAVDYEKEFMYSDALKKYKFVLKYFPNSNNQSYIEKRINIINNKIEISNLLFNNSLKNNKNIFTRIEYAQLLNSYSLNPQNHLIKETLLARTRKVLHAIDSIPDMYEFIDKKDTIGINSLIANNGWIYFEKDLYEEIIQNKIDCYSFIRALTQAQSANEFIELNKKSWYLSSNSIVFKNTDIETTFASRVGKGEFQP